MYIHGRFVRKVEELYVWHYLGIADGMCDTPV